MEQSHSDRKTVSEVEKDKKIKREKARREAEQFKRKYFDYYDDVKISVKEDW